MLQSSKIFQEKTNNIQPKIAVILGSGLTNFFEDPHILHTISYEELPDFSQPTVEGHAGKLVVGTVDTKNVVCMYGRSHIYEGREPTELVNPIRVLKDIGCKLLIITNAAGSLKEEMPPGSFMVVNDHLNWSGFNPLIGPNDESYGPRFSDMSDAYHQSYRDQLINVAKKNNQKLFEGVYCMYSGPSFETPAEIKALQVLGGSAVGMSTVPEVIVGVHAGMKILGISCITNMASGILNQPLDHEEVMETAGQIRSVFISLIKQTVSNV